MIVAGGLNLRRLVEYVGRPLLSLFLFDLLIAGAYVYGGQKWLAMPDIPLSIFGSAIGVLVGFRNNSSYARWWEARTLWGAIVNNSRSFAREALSMIIPPESDQPAAAEAAAVKRQLVLLQIAYVHALRCHLRGQPPWEELSGLVTESELAELRRHSNVPVALQQRMSILLRYCFEQGWLDTIRWSSLDRTLSALMDSQGGAERIKNTPIPKQYDAFPQFFVKVYCLLLPFGMVANLELLTPLGSTLVGFIFLALDEIGRDLETPFESKVHDVPLTSITKGIEINLKQLLGEPDVPEPEKPVRGVLW